VADAFAAGEARWLEEPDRLCEVCLEHPQTAPDGVCDDCAADRLAEQDH
jgi:hypothetical protein